MDDILERNIAALEELAQAEGLDYYPIDFEEVPDSFMMEIAVYGLPIRMPHWSFGVRYIHQLVQHRMGHSRLFEVVFPGNPNRAYLANRNSVDENTLVAAHVIGHADFSRNNLLFRKSHEQVGQRIVEQAAAHSRRIVDAVQEHGQDRVEAVLDAALALEQHIDIDKGLQRPPYEHPALDDVALDDEFSRRFTQLTDSRAPDASVSSPVRVPLPPAPERDLLWFIARYCPDMEDWERDIFLAVREESFYFYPVFACQIMNEGWACFWHARLLREADFLPHELYIDAIRSHSDVVRPIAGDQQIALGINPYHLGFKMWEHIVARDGIDHARRIMAEDDDFSFIRNNLDAELAEELDLFVFDAQANGSITVAEHDIDALRDSLLAPKYNFSAPAIFVDSIEIDGTLRLRHDYSSDGRGLDRGRAERVLEYIERIWRRPVTMLTLGEAEEEQLIELAHS